MDSPSRCLLLCSSVRICGFRPGKHSRSCSAFRRTQTVTSAFSVWNHSANAGFQVLGVLNEPSDASIEFGHCQRQSRSSPETILVYDLGGGTFDASLFTLYENVHHVVASEGIPTIGGDDFDQILTELALEVAGIDQRTRENLPAAAWF